MENLHWILLEKIKKGSTEKINEPQLPEMVLLGLIFVNFLPPKVFPNTKPPISEHMHINKM